MSIVAKRYLTKLFIETAEMDVVEATKDYLRKQVQDLAAIRGHKIDMDTFTIHESTEFLDNEELLALEARVETV